MQCWQLQTCSRHRGTATARPVSLGRVLCTPSGIPCLWSLQCTHLGISLVLLLPPGSVSSRPCISANGTDAVHFIFPCCIYSCFICCPPFCCLKVLTSVTISAECRCCLAPAFLIYFCCWQFTPATYRQLAVFLFFIYGRSFFCLK